MAVNWDNFGVNKSQNNNNNNNFNNSQDIQKFGQYLGNLNINPQAMAMQILNSLSPNDKQSITNQANNIYNNLFNRR